MCCKSPAKLLRSVKRITKFTEKKTKALAAVVFLPLDIVPLAKTGETDEPQSLAEHQAIDEHQLDDAPQPDDEPQPVDEPRPVDEPQPVDKTQPVDDPQFQPEPVTKNDVLTKQQFIDFMESLKKDLVFKLP